MIYVGTIFFCLKDGTDQERTMFNADMTKVVKCMVKYAEILLLQGYRVSGSMVEELDKYWESDSKQEGKEYEERV